MSEEEEAERLSDYNYALGRKAGLEQAMKLIEEKAKEQWWAHGNSPAVNYMRLIADELKKMAWKADPRPPSRRGSE